MYNGFLQPNFTGSGTPTLPWEGVIWTCWGTDVLVLQTFESDDGTVIMIVILPTMADACKIRQLPFDILSITENLKKVFD